MNGISEDLSSFVRKFIVKNNIKNVDLNDINTDTSLDLDLNLFDVDLDLFLTDFLEEFSIDYSRFIWDKYGYPKGSYLFILCRSILNYKLNWVKNLTRKLYRPKIKLELLQKAIDSGVLE